MRVAVCSDEAYPVHATVRGLLEARGHEPVVFGAFWAGAASAGVGGALPSAGQSGRPADVPCAEVAEQAALAVALGDCQEGIFFCWSGTGISMAANKIFGIRAALCSDPGTAKAARIWNHANVLCLSNRQLSDDMAKEVLEAWFDTPPGSVGQPGVLLLQELDQRQRRPR